MKQINYSKIQQECQNAWNKLVPWSHTKAFGFCSSTFLVEDLLLQGELETRLLFDFFDSVGIICNVSDNAYFDSAWQGSIRVLPNIEDEGVGLCSSRTEIEVETFTRAFYVFEEQLKIAENSPLLK